MRKRLSLFILLFVLLFSFIACGEDKLELALQQGFDEIYQGDEVDFTSLIYIVDERLVKLTNEQIDTTKVDFTKPGTYELSINYNGLVRTIDVIIKELKIFIDCEDSIESGTETIVNIKTEPERIVKDFKLISNNEDIIKVEGNKIIALKEGKATIEATYFEAKASKEITITKKIDNNVYAEKIEANVLETMEIGEEFNIVVNLLPSNVTDNSYTIKSSDDSIVSVKQNTIIAHKEGSVLITITSGDEKVTSEYFVTVNKQENTIPSLEKVYETFSNPDLYNFRFTYELIVSELDYTYQESYEVNNNVIVYTYESLYGDCTDYVVFGDKTYYYTIDENDYICIDENNEYFDLYLSYLLLLDFSTLDNYEVEYKNGIFTFKDQKKANDELFGSYDSDYTVTDFSFTLKDELIDVLSVTCKVYDEEDGSWYTYIERIKFQDYGKVTITEDDVNEIVNIKKEDVFVSGVQTNIPSMMYIGEEIDLVISLLPVTAANKEYTIKSTNEEILVINNNKLQALKEGLATIIITSNDGHYVEEIEVSVATKTDDIPSLTSALSKFSNSEALNYRVLYGYSIEETNEYFVEEYSFYNNIIKYYYEGETQFYSDYIYYGDKLYYISEESDGYYAYPEGTDDFDWYFDYATLVDFSVLSKIEFIYKDGTFFARDPKSANDLLLGGYEDDYTISSFSFTLKDGLIDTLNIVSRVYDSQDKAWYTCKDEFVFLDYDKVYIDEDLIKSYIGISQEESKQTDFIFVDEYFNTENNDSVFVATKQAYAFDTNRGIQFLQSGGQVEITSNVLFENVSTITLVVATNQTNGMNISVKVGNVYLTYENEEYATVKKTAFNESVQVTFQTSQNLSGALTIILTPNGIDKSMYIFSVCINGNNSEVMEKQEYDENSFNDNRLHEKIVETGEIIGLPSTGAYNVLVIPIQFAGEKAFTEEQLTRLELSFNGTKSDTGWESVKSFYYQSSYGKLDFTFDVLEPYTSKYNGSYYQKYYDSDFDDYGNLIVETGDTLLLLEALAYYDEMIDYNKYDYNQDGVLDGVYLIYNHQIAYDESNDLYWAFVNYYLTTEEKNQTFDGLEVYMYLFAGVDFTIEDVEGGYVYTEVVDGLIINAETYIHETGHLLSLDDYYDYYEDQGGNLGLGGADMMDYNIGDHCSYTKLMLDWINPRIVNESTTITVSSFEQSGDTILILLDSNDSYFCEYLLIDLYTNDGLNELKSGKLFEGSEAGIRVYHVSSKVTNPYNNSYGALTDYNNSTTDIPLIMLVEKDGEKGFKSSNGVASENDLFIAGDKLSDVNIERNDGKKLCFDIEILSIENGEAEIKITFN